MGFEPGTNRFQIQRSNHSAMLPPPAEWMFNSNCFAADDVKELHFGGFLTKKSADDKQVIVPL